MGKKLGDAVTHSEGSRPVGLREQQRELIPPIPRRGVHGTARVAKHLGHPTECPAAHEMAVAVVDFLEVVHVEKDQSERALGAPRALDLGLDPVDQLPVVRETRERITHREVAELPFNLSPLGHDRGQDERRHRRDPHVGLQQDRPPACRLRW